MSLDPKAKIPLAMVAIIAERAYRRGFQQGHHYAKSNYKVMDLYKWRYERSESLALLPENGKPMHSELRTALERLSIEERNRIETYLIKEAVAVHKKEMRLSRMRTV